MHKRLIDPQPTSVYKCALTHCNRGNKLQCRLDRKDRDSVVGIAAHYGLDGPRIETGGVEIFNTRRTGPGAHPAFYTMGTGSVPRVKRPERGVNHQPHTAPRLKKK